MTQYKDLYKERFIDNTISKFPKTKDWLEQTVPENHQINLISFAKALEFDVEFKELRGNSEKSETTIFIDKNIPKHTQRFALAQEIGIILAQNTHDVILPDVQQILFANKFAILFLLPENILTQEIDTALTEFDTNPQRLSYADTKTAINIVAKKLDLAPLVVSEQVTHHHIFTPFEE